MPPAPAGCGNALLSVFERIYVINLPSRADRRAEIGAQLRRIGLSLEHPRVVLVDAVRPEAAGGFPSVGARGCFESHLAVLEAGLEAGLESFLIMEDDADFVADFEARAEPILAALVRQDWGLFYGWNPDTYGQPTGPDATGLIALAPSRGVTLSHFIGVRREAAALALPYLQAIASRPPGDPRGGAMHVDGAYGWFRNAFPQVVTLAPAHALAVLATEGLTP